MVKAPLSAIKSRVRGSAASTDNGRRVDQTTVYWVSVKTLDMCALCSPTMTSSWRARHTHILSMYSIHLCETMHETLLEKVTRTFCHHILSTSHLLSTCARVSRAGAAGHAHLSAAHALLSSAASALLSSRCIGLLKIHHYQGLLGHLTQIRHFALQPSAQARAP